MTQSPALPAHILFATDLGARSDRAQDRAIRLARDWNAKLTVVHALDTLDAPNDQPSRPTAEGARSRAFSLLREQFDKDVEVVVEEGKPGDVVLQAAEARPVDLIVTGIAGNDPIAQSIFGSATSKLVRKAAAPVLVVKKRGLEPYRRIVVATDLSAASAASLRLALRLFDPSAITLFHVYEAPFSRFLEERDLYEQKLKPGALDDVRRFAVEAAGEAVADQLHVEVVTGDAAVRIADYAAQMDTDLVVAGTQGRSGIVGVLMGSVALALLDEVPCDVMVVPA
ncbi:universal stress protein [Mesorhizobium sp. VNQ89]|uniref:universal stress protein n=1 Tax=Mesorhizobium quangtriensis TaxID=3157709 RepID=UPI0032B81227